MTPISNRRGVEAVGEFETAELVEEFLAGCRARGLRPATVAGYQLVLQRLVRMFDRVPQRAGQVERLLGELGDVAPATRWDYHKRLGVFFNWASARYGLGNPLDQVRAPRLVAAPPRGLTSDQVARVVHHAGERSQQLRALVLLLVDTGLRISEALGLAWSDIGDGELQVDGKTGPRSVPATPEVLQELVGVGTAAGPFAGWTRDHAYHLVAGAMAAANLQGAKRGPHARGWW
jgi:integrase